MEFSQILTFALVASLLVVSPGPNGVLILKTVPTSGKAAGFANCAGFVTAFYLHGALSILGISALLVQSSELFFAVKMLGAAYLCWIGVNAMREAWVGDKSGQQDKPAQTVVPSQRKSSVPKAFVEGFLTNALNPKVSMFYLAAFPQFIPLGGNATAAFLLVFVHSILNLVWFSAMVLLVSRFVSFTKRGLIQRVLKAITGTVFCAFGVKLASMQS